MVKCPHCGSTSLITERSPNGKTTCLDCETTFPNFGKTKTTMKPQIIEQKVEIKMRGGLPGSNWIAGESMGDTYLFSQCRGNSGIEKDLKDGWIVKHIWEDSRVTTILLERSSWQ